MESVNSTIRSQLGHRTIRQWTGEPLAGDTREALLAVAARTASSTGMQQAGIIRITSPELRQGLAAIANQQYLVEAPELWVFIVDTARGEAILRERGVSGEGPASMDAFFQGFTDACVMAQNVVVAAESLGLGACYFGSILNDCQAVIELLDMPQGTFPVVGLGIGEPAQDPQLKPRMPMELRVSENSYQRPPSWSEALRDYDEAMRTYYDLREPSRTVPAFTDQVVARMTNVNPKRAEILRVIGQQGFDFRL
ncbi:MAG: NADPH-dependent oxidoreductase [Actinomycetaceae bacterium]|nr:NADPH-dependent oxidoreductase [Actinomycetaceae bacterium]